mmetsp:Transcript_13235/g.20663  ORF Transcript_13235/g.20663 Transcript_13235/m.20663 type:complete len:217 (-) Transcript_13235:20-670(-)
MCQAYYSQKITEVFEQMIMGSANTPESIMKFYRRLNLSKCSLNLIEIPKKCTSMVFSDIFEYCVKFNNMIPIAVYKRHSDDPANTGNKFQGNQDLKADGLGTRADEKTQRKSYMWLHPPRKIELSISDELFVLCEKNVKESMQENQKDKTPPPGGKPLKNEGKKIQSENLKELNKLNSMLKELLYSSKELQNNVERSGGLLNSDLGFKIRSGLETF